MIIVGAREGSGRQQGKMRENKTERWILRKVERRTNQEPTSLMEWEGKNFPL